VQKRVSRFVDDLLSDPAVAARNVERLQAAEIPAPPAEPSPARQPLRAAQGEEQPGLFSAPAVSGRVYPPLAEWAARPPAAPDGKLRLSATAIEDYLNCPLKFKFHHFLKIPTGPQAALTFGNILHGCVRRYFELRQKTLPRFEDLEQAYRAAWKSAGFEDAYQEETYKKAGLEQLRQFVAQQNAAAPPPPPARLEQAFSLDLGDVVLEGRIDRIHPLEPGNAPEAPAVELIDYKTGRPRTQKDADQSLQLSIYALAARQHLRLEPQRLTFYNLTNNQPVSSVRTEQDLAKVRDRVREVAGEIRGLRFPPRPGFICKYCDFVPICPAHEDEF
jgi:RecB family exonuclease